MTLIHVVDIIISDISHVYLYVIHVIYVMLYIYSTKRKAHDEIQSWKDGNS